MKIAFTARFQKAWNVLENNERKSAVKALRNLADNIRHPALAVKKIQGTGNIWEARVSRAIRITFQIQNSVILLRNIGKHDETLKKP